MSKLRGIIIFIIIAVGIIFYFINQEKENSLKSTLQGTKVMDFVTNHQIFSKSDFLFESVKNKKIEIDVEDKFFKIKGMEDKTIFLKVFGWDCKFCKKEIPELVNLKNKLGDAFEIIAVEAQQHSREASLKYIEEFGINYHIISGDSQGEFYAYLQEKYGWKGIIPLTIVIAKGGKVIAFEVGAKSYSLADLMEASLSRK